MTPASETAATTFDSRPFAAAFGIDLNAVPGERAKAIDDSLQSLIAEAKNKSKQSIIADYWMLPKKLWAGIVGVCALLTAICLLAVAVLNWVNHTEIEATKQAQKTVADRLGTLAGEATIERVDKAVQKAEQDGAALASRLRDWDANDPAARLRNIEEKISMMRDRNSSQLYEIEHLQTELRIAGSKLAVAQDTIRRLQGH